MDVVSFLLSLVWPSLSPPPDPSDHELRGSASRPGVCPGQRAVPRPQPCNPFRLHWRDCSETARWIAAVLAFPRSLRQDGCAAVPRESGEELKTGLVVVTLRELWPFRCLRIEGMSGFDSFPFFFAPSLLSSRWTWRSMENQWIYIWSLGTMERHSLCRKQKTIRCVWPCSGYCKWNTLSVKWHLDSSED